MTITFNAIKLHDLVYLNNGDDIDDWFLVTKVSERIGFFKATQIGYDIRPVMVLSGRMGIVQKHYSTAGLIEAVPALIEIAAGRTTMVDGATVYMVMFEAQEIAEAALRAVRGEETK